MAGTYLAKVDFVKDDLVGMADAPEPGDEGQSGHYSKRNLVLPLIAIAGCGDLLGRVLAGDVLELDVGDIASVLLLARAGDIALAYASLRRGSRSHAGQTG